MVVPFFLFGRMKNPEIYNGKISSLSGQRSSYQLFLFVLCSNGENACWAVWGSGLQYLEWPLGENSSAAVLPVWYPAVIMIHPLCDCCCSSRYLEVEWEVRKGSLRSFGKEVMKGSSPRVPQQDNFSDCGVYVLQYVESFFEVSQQAGTLASSARPP